MHYPWPRSVTSSPFVPSSTEHRIANSGLSRCSPIICQTQAPFTSKGFSRDTVQEERRDSGFAGARTFANGRCGDSSGNLQQAGSAVPANSSRFQQLRAPGPGTGQNSHLDSHYQRHISRNGAWEIWSRATPSRSAQSQHKLESCRFESPLSLDHQLPCHPPHRRPLRPRFPPAFPPCPRRRSPRHSLMPLCIMLGWQQCPRLQSRRLRLTTTTITDTGKPSQPKVAIR